MKPIYRFRKKKLTVDNEKNGFLFHKHKNKSNEHKNSSNEQKNSLNEHKIYLNEHRHSSN